MPFSGGTYTKWNSASGGWVGDKTAGTGILATRHDSQDDDFATAINSCLTKTGANSPTANINWAGYKITSLGNATTSGDAVNLGQLQVASGFYLDTVNNRVGINQTSPTEKLHLNGVIRIDATSEPSYNGAMRFWSESGFGNRYDGTAHRWDIGNGPGRVEGMRLNSAGQVMVNTTSTSVFSTGKVYVEATGTDHGQVVRVAHKDSTCLALDNQATSGTRYLAAFYQGGSLKGSITHDGTNTAFNTSSDYRLKTSVEQLNDGLATIQQIKPRKWKWVSNESNGIGFVAHELQEIVPQAVTGEKDEIDDAGNPRYQGVDSSKLVPYLVAAVQELSAKVQALEARYESTVG